MKAWIAAWAVPGGGVSAPPATWELRHMPEAVLEADEIHEKPDEHGQWYEDRVFTLSICLLRTQGGVEHNGWPLPPGPGQRK